MALIVLYPNLSLYLYCSYICDWQKGRKFMIGFSATTFILFDLIQIN